MLCIIIVIFHLLIIFVLCAYSNNCKRATDLAPWLNTYIFERIFSHIRKLESQVRVIRAMPEFKEDALRLWARQNYTNTIGPNCNLASHFWHTKDFKFFLNLMTPYFKNFIFVGNRHMTVSTLGQYLQQLRILGIDSLPEIEVCRLKPVCPTTIEDENIRELSALLPNLKIFEANNSLSGRYLDRFKQLEELHLYTRWCPIPLQSQYVQSICVNMKSLRLLDIRNAFISNRVSLEHIDLPCLEELQINLHTLKTIIPQVLRLPCLRKLGVNLSRAIVYHQNFNDGTFQTILLAMAPYITYVSVNSNLLPFGNDWDAELGVINLPKLRGYNFVGWKHSIPFLNGHNIPREKIVSLGVQNWKQATVVRLIRLIKQYPNLREMYLFRCHASAILCQLESFLFMEAAAGVVRPKLHIYYFFNRTRYVMSSRVRMYWQNHKYLCLDKTVHNSFSCLSENGFDFEFKRD